MGFAVENVENCLWLWKYAVEKSEMLLKTQM